MKDRSAPRVSISTMFLWDQTPKEMAKTLTKSGLKGVEFWVETPWYWEGGRRLDRLEVIKREFCNFDTSIHAPVMDLNSSSYNERVCKATIDESLIAIDLAETLGAKIVTIHPGKRTAKRPVRSVEREKFKNYLESCIDRAQSKGISLSLENLEPAPWNMCTTPEEMASILDEYPIGLTLDISHAVPPESLALSFVDMLSDFLLNVHVSTTCDNVRHLPPSDGSIDSILIALLDANYSGPLTLELDDKKYPKTLSKKDKVEVLRKEKEYLESHWR